MEAKSKKPYRSSTFPGFEDHRPILFAVYAARGADAVTLPRVRRS
jgi:hypothetical protein